MTPFSIDCPRCPACHAPRWLPPTNASRCCWHRSGSASSGLIHDINVPVGYLPTAARMVSVRMHVLLDHSRPAEGRTADHRLEFTMRCSAALVALAFCFLAEGSAQAHGRGSVSAGTSTITLLLKRRIARPISSSPPRQDRLSLRAVKIGSRPISSLFRSANGVLPSSPPREQTIILDHVAMVALLVAPDLRVGNVSTHPSRLVSPYDC